MLGATVLLAALTGGAATPSSAGSQRTAADSLPDAAGPETGEEPGATGRAARPAGHSSRGVPAPVEGRTQPLMQSLSAAGPAPGPQAQAATAPEAAPDDPAAAGTVEAAAAGDEPCPPRASWWDPVPPGAHDPATDTDRAERYGDDDHRDGDVTADGGRTFDGDEEEDEDDGGRDHGDDGWDSRSEGGERH